MFRIRICMDPHWLDSPEAGSCRKKIEKKEKYVNLILVANFSTWVLIQISLKNTKHKQRSGQHTQARKKKKIKKNNKKKLCCYI